jgi:hypothetical protein
MHTFLRRHVTAVKGRFYEAASIAKQVANPHELWARSSDDVTLESFRSEKALGHRLCPSRYQRQDWIVLQSEADHAIWHCGGEQLLNGFPERTDVHGTVQTEQRSFQCRIDHRLRITSGPESCLGSLHVSPPPSRNRRFVVSTLDNTTVQERSMIGRSKTQPKLPCDHRAIRDAETLNNKGGK